MKITLQRIRNAPRITPDGVAFLLLTVLTGVLAFVTTLSLIFLIFSMMLGAFTVSFLVAQLTLRKLKVKRVFPSRVYAGMLFQVQLRVENCKRWTPSFALNLQDGVQTEGATYYNQAFVLSVGGEEESSTEYQIAVHKRGRHHFTDVKISTRFPFGFFEKTITLKAPDTILVYPKIGRIADDKMPAVAPREMGNRTHNRRGSEDFVALREYRGGDDPHLIHWRTSARACKLLVKQMESERSRNLLLVLDTCTESLPRKDRKRLLETAVSFTATMLHHMLKKGFSVELCTFTPDYCQLHSGAQKRQLTLIMDNLAVLEGGAHTLDDMLPHIRVRRKDYAVFTIRLSSHGAAKFDTVIRPDRSFLVGSPQMERAFERKTMYEEMQLHGS